MAIERFLQSLQISLRLDWQWIRTISMHGRWSFLIKKYLLLFFPFMFAQTSTRTYRISVGKTPITLPSPHHIGFLQSVFLDHAFLREYINPHATIVDVGAHIGEFALMSRLYLQAGQVHSIEPTNRSFELLRQNNTTNYNTAICAGNTATMHIPTMTVMTSGFSSIPHDTSEIVQCASLDTIQEIAALPSIDLLKIDVEGMEYDVLEESVTTLQKTTYLLLEVSLDRPSSAGALTCIQKVYDILPNATIVSIGHVHENIHTKHQSAVDLLFATNP